MLRDVLVMSLQLVLGIIGGVMICAAWLMWKPVTIMDGPPSAAREITDRHEVVYVRGKPATRGAQGARKQKAFLDQTPGELVFVEEDVNRWLAGAYGSKELTFAITGTGVTLAPRVPAARLIGDELELGVEIGIDRDGSSRAMVAQTRGKFTNRNGRAVFVPRQVYLGSCPLPWNLGGKQLYQRMMNLFPVPQNVSAAWAGVSQASVADNRLHVVMGVGGPAAASVSAPSVETPALATVPAAPPPAPAVATESAPVQADSLPPSPVAESAPVDTSLVTPDSANPAPAPPPTAEATAPAAPAE